MKVENIKSNGISYNKPAKNTCGDTIKLAVSLFRMRHTNHEIFGMLSEDFRYYTGSRFNDDETVVTRICSALTKNAISHHMCSNFSGEEHELLLLEGIIKSFVDSLSGSEMDTIILDALRDCAESDHWYKFEKDWN